jgi:hypothetical protein
MKALELDEDELDEVELLPVPEPVADVPLEPEEPLPLEPLVEVPAETSEPTRPEMVRIVPAVGAVIEVSSTAVWAEFTEACAWVTDSWSCAIVDGST